jgi:L-amino acid N-acyltransferase YncA
VHIRGEGKLAKSPYKIVDVNETNLDEYDILCQKSRKKEEGYQNKLKWIKERFKEGLRLKLLLVDEGPKRGFTSRGFIEYVPGKYAWRGIDAKDYMVIHCIWVVGKNKKKGYGTKLLEQCMKEARAKGMQGVAVVTSNSGWLPRKELFIKNGFEKADAMPPDFELYAKRFSKNAVFPKFFPISEEKIKSYGKGLTILDSCQCPYSNALIILLKRMANEANIPVKIQHISSPKEAQENSVHPYGTFCILLNGKVVSYKPGNLRDVNRAIIESKK